jgi:hypothetical protein
MKKIFTLAFLLISLYASAQDSTKTNPVVGSVSISSKNLWRGNVYGNNAPSISGTLGYRFKSNTEIGVIGTSPLNGNRDGYGIWMELYASQTVGAFTFVLDDYYFFNAEDSLNDYGNWSSNDTQHLIEGRVKYDAGRFNVTASYVLYAATGLDNSLYLEGEYFLLPSKLSVSVGGVFGASALNFYDDGGVTHFGFTGYGNVNLGKDFSLPLRLSVMTSPNYKNASEYPKFTQNPINFVIGTTF